MNIFNDETAIELSPEPTIWELNKSIYTMFKKYHFMGFDYRKHRPKEFKGADVPKNLMKNDDFLSSVNYVAHLFDCIKDNTFTIHLGGIDEIPELKGYNNFIAKEARQAESNGELCIYCSIVLYFLLIAECNICTDHIKYCQGLFKHKLREDFPPFIPFGKWQQGLHSWVTVGDSVLDLTIGQNDYFFDFKGELPYTIGKTHEGMQLLGHEELDVVARKYKKKYADRAGVDEETWLLNHRVASKKAYMELLKEMMEQIQTELSEIAVEKN